MSKREYLFALITIPLLVLGLHKTLEAPNAGNELRIPASDGLTESASKTDSGLKVEAVKAEDTDASAELAKKKTLRFSQLQAPGANGKRVEYRSPLGIQKRNGRKPQSEDPSAGETVAYGDEVDMAMIKIMHLKMTPKRRKMIDQVLAYFEKNPPTLSEDSHGQGLIIKDPKAAKAWAELMKLVQRDSGNAG